MLESNNFFSTNLIFIDHLDKTLYCLNVETYLRTKETKVNTIAAENFSKALKDAKAAILLEQYKDFPNVFSKEGFDSLLEKQLWNHTIELKNRF